MLKTRIIPVLTLKGAGTGIIKTRKFKKQTYLGDVLNAVRIFNEKEVDELVILDIFATKEKREPNYERIKDIATECFMPLAYGGGVKTLTQVKKIFDQGIEKVIFGSAGGDLELIKKASEIYGSQSIVACVDVKKNFLGKYQVFIESGTKVISLSLENYIQSIVDAGAGEIILQYINNDSEMQGYNLELINKVSSMIDVPLIVLGGAGRLADFKLAVKEGASAVAAGSLFVFKGKHRGVLINYPTQEKLLEILK